MFRRIVENRHFEKLVKWLTYHIRPLTFLWYLKKMAHPPLNRLLRRNRRNRNQIRVADEIPIAESIRQMAENLQFSNNNLVMLRPLPAGFRMTGIATEEIQVGDYVTFDYQNTTARVLVRKLTFEEVQLIQNGEITSDHTINRVERVARAMRHANTEEAIEFIINEHCQYVSALNPEQYPGLQHPKKHEMDEDYPHECYSCHKALKYPEAWTEVKKTGMTERKFQKLWELEEIEFYCCFCYDKKTRGSSGESRESIYTRFRHPGRDILDSIRASMGIAAFRWGSPGIHELNPTILFPDALRTLQAVARHRFGPPPVILHTLGSHPPIRNIRQFSVDICIGGDRDRQILYRHNIVITTEDHERFRGIGPLDITMESPNINTEVLARLVAELVFHWISAKVLLHPENEEWIPLNEIADEISPSINHFIERMTYAEGIVGPDALERFARLFPNFPHLWSHNNQSCDFCGLSPREVYTSSPRGMDIIQQPMGIHRDYELSFDSLDSMESINRVDFNLLREQVENDLIASTGIPRDQLFGTPHSCRENLDADLHCRICRRSMVDIDAEASRNRRFRR